MKVIEGNFDASGKKFAIVASRWNDYIVDKLVTGAKDAILRHNGQEENITLIHCPGAFEIPMICKMAAESKNYDAIIALGCVIRGATTHYEIVANGSSAGVGAVSMETGVPCTLGILTTETIEQAIERAGTKAGNKGFEAAMTAIEMINLISKVK